MPAGVSAQAQSRYQAYARGTQPGGQQPADLLGVEPVSGVAGVRPKLCAP